MTADQRARIRAARDKHARQLRAGFLTKVGRLTCRGCGADLDTFVPGCGRCGDRKRARQRAST